MQLGAEALEEIVFLTGSEIRWQLGDRADEVEGHRPLVGGGGREDLEQRPRIVADDGDLGARVGGEVSLGNQLKDGNPGQCRSRDTISN